MILCNQLTPVSNSLFQTLGPPLYIPLKLLTFLFPLDIDECTAMTDNCDTSVGVCTNTQGGYTCSCASGYMLAADERTCSSKKINAG